nr:MAG TPA: hypothetical protein [Caudoviricetes sp.]
MAEELFLDWRMSLENSCKVSKFQFCKQRLEKRGFYC